MTGLLADADGREGVSERLKFAAVTLGLLVLGVAAHAASVSPLNPQQCQVPAACIDINQAIANVNSAVFPGGLLASEAPRDVREFGAVDIGFGNYTGTDSTAALQAALAWCGNGTTTGGRSITLGSGRFAATSGDLTVPRQCKLTSAAPPNGQIVVGGSYLTTYLSAYYMGGVILHDTSHHLYNAGTIDGVSVFPYGLAPATTVAEAWNARVAWAGTGVESITVDGPTYFQNAWVGGWATCWSGNSSHRFFLQNLMVDCPANIYSTNSTDIDYIQNLEAWPIMTGNSLVPTPMTVSAVADDGSGHIKLTVDSTTQLTGATNPKVLVNLASTAYLNANGQWTATVNDSTHLTLTGSTFGSATATGTYAANSYTVTLASTVGLDRLMTVTGTGIPGSTTIAAIDDFNKIIWLSNATTGAGPHTLTFASPGSYSGSAGRVIFNYLANNTKSINLDTNQTQVFLNNVFSFGWPTNLYVKDNLAITAEGVSCDSWGFSHQNQCVITDGGAPAGPVQIIGGSATGAFGPFLIQNETGFYPPTVSSILLANPDIGIVNGASSPGLVVSSSTQVLGGGVAYVELLNDENVKMNVLGAYVLDQLSGSVSLNAGGALLAPRIGQYAFTPNFQFFDGASTFTTPAGWTFSALNGKYRYDEDGVLDVWIQAQVSAVSGTPSGGAVFGNLPASCDGLAGASALRLQTMTGLTGSLDTVSELDFVRLEQVGSTGSGDLGYAPFTATSSVILHANCSTRGP